MRQKPLEPAHQIYGPEFDRMVALGRTFWPHNIWPATTRDPVIYVDLLMQDIRPAIRNLFLANAIRRVVPARVVVLAGAERHWNENVWQYYDLEKVVELARSYQVDEVLDLSSLRDQVVGGAKTVRVFNETREVPQVPSLSAERLAEIGDSSVTRILRYPRVSEDLKSHDDFDEIREDATLFARIYDALLGEDTLAFITSHVDYHQWGAGVETAIAKQVPVVHMQSTGSLKAYAAFPENMAENRDIGLRGHISLELGRIFEEQIWPRRELLRRSAELTSWRAKSNLGRPSWWRGGGAVSEQNFHSSAERRSIRRAVMRQLGMDRGKPVVAVFAHAVSDAVGSNHEAFDNLVDWFEKTVAYAADHPEVNWLFLDHPQQAHYDATEHFEQLAANFDVPHMVFRPSMALTRNALWSLTDLAVTVRGSVSNEFPAYGVPALQAGWSEWSHVGMSMRADSQEEYWQLLRGAIDKLLAGERPITVEQIERARLWMWFYRAGADVVTPLVPQWDMGRAKTLYNTISNAYSQIDSDGDPGFRAVARMWLNRSPVLTRFDFAAADDSLAQILAPVGGFQKPMAIEQDMTEPIRTAMDQPRLVSTLPITVDSSKSGDIVYTEGLAPGTAIVGRASKPAVALAFKVPSDRTLRIELSLACDEPSDGWWQRWRQKSGEEMIVPGDRLVEVSCQGEARGHITFAHGRLSRYQVACDVDASALDQDGLLVVELNAVKPDPKVADAVVGLAVDAVRISVVEDESALTTFEAIHDDDYFATRNQLPKEPDDLELARHPAPKLRPLRTLPRRIAHRAKRELRKLGR